jgi:hypothetical protein
MNKLTYRMSLTQAHAYRMLELMRAVPNLSTIDIEILGKLSVLIAKSENGSIVPSYVAKNSTKDLEALGGSPPMHSNGLTKEAYWQQCYHKMLSDGIESLSLEERAANLEHQYLNGIMDGADQLLFEAGELV